MNFNLPKSERLHAEKRIKELFNEGSSFFLYPFKVIFLRKIDLAGQANQVLFSVSKKKIKRTKKSKNQIVASIHYFVLLLEIILV